jgi:hypothetical protein
MMRYYLSFFLHFKSFFSTRLAILPFLFLSFYHILSNNQIAYVRVDLIAFLAYGILFVSTTKCNDKKSEIRKTIFFNSRQEGEYKNPLVTIDGN